MRERDEQPISQDEQQDSEPRKSKAKAVSVDSSKKPRERSVRLPARDKELLAHVAAARYLNYAQVRALVFDRPLRGGNSKDAALSDTVARRRLPQLCGMAGGTAYLRALSYRT